MLATIDADPIVRALVDHYGLTALFLLLPLALIVFLLRRISTLEGDVRRGQKLLNHTQEEARNDIAELHDKLITIQDKHRGEVGELQALRVEDIRHVSKGLMQILSEQNQLNRENTVALTKARDLLSLVADKLDNVRTSA